MGLNNILSKYIQSTAVGLAISYMPYDVINGIEEIRIRVGLPVMVKLVTGSFFINSSGAPCPPETALIPSKKDIDIIVERISGYCLYSYEEEIQKGFITIEGGHRVGISGKAVLENGVVKSIRNISSVNIRIAKQIKGCSDGIVKKLCQNGRVLSSIIISPPALGKTTLLRDIIRNISDGKIPGLKHICVGVVDERSEIAACRGCMPQLDVGCQTDVLDGCPKAQGLIMLIRSMSPSVIAVDEIGGQADVDAIEKASNAGVSLICTIHGGSVSEVKNRPDLKRLMSMNVFKRFITISEKRVLSVYDQNGNIL